MKTNELYNSQKKSKPINPKAVKPTTLNGNTILCGETLTNLRNATLSPPPTSKEGRSFTGGLLSKST